MNLLRPRPSITGDQSGGDDVGEEELSEPEAADSTEVAETAIVDEPSNSTPERDPDEEPTILAIDDSPTIRKLVTMTLEKNGFKVLTAEDGMNALDLIKSVQPALILMDINMPNLNGYQLCKLVKKHEETRDIPVIMLSGNDGIFDKYRGKRCGCDDYMTKPFETAELVAKISAHLSRTVTGA